jgi:hypothetical protein
VGTILEGSEVEEVKNFFIQSLWETAKPIGDLRKFKQIWNASQQSAKMINRKN